MSFYFLCHIYIYVVCVTKKAHIYFRVGLGGPRGTPVSLPPDKLLDYYFASLSHFYLFSFDVCYLIQKIHKWQLAADYLFKLNQESRRVKNLFDLNKCRKYNSFFS